MSKYITFPRLIIPMAFLIILAAIISISVGAEPPKPSVAAGENDSLALMKAELGLQEVTSAAVTTVLAEQVGQYGGAS